MKIIKYLFLLLTINMVTAQEFEGIVRYGMTFEPTTAHVDNEKTIAKIKKLKSKKESDSVLVAYKKGEDFLKYILTPKSINIYDSKTHLVYSIDENDKYIVTTTLTNTAKPDRRQPITSTMDTLVEINNIKCKEMHFDYGYYKTTVYYNEDPKYKGMGKPFFYKSLIDFDVRNSGLKEVLIVKYIQQYGEINTIINLLEIKEMPIDSSIFTIPEYKKSRKYEYDEQEKLQVYKIVDKNYHFPDLGKL